MKLTSFWHVYEVRLVNADLVEERTSLGETLEATAIKKLTRIAEARGYVFKKNRGFRGRWVHPETFDTMELCFGKV